MDEDDLKWVTNEKNIVLFLNSSTKIVALKPLVVGNEVILHRSMQNDALIHREGLTLTVRGST